MPRRPYRPLGGSSNAYPASQRAALAGARIRAQQGPVPAPGFPPDPEPPAAEDPAEPDQADDE